MITTKKAIEILENLKPSVQKTTDYCASCSRYKGKIVLREDCDCYTKPCPDCECGEIEVIDQDRVRESTITPPYKIVTCETCNGEGEIEVGL